MSFDDCRGESHNSEEDRDEADVTIVEEILNGIVKDQTDYYTDNEDWPHGCGYIVTEVAHDWPARFEDTEFWDQNQYYDFIEEMISNGEIEVDLEAENADCGEDELPWTLRETSDSVGWIEEHYNLPDEDKIIERICEEIDGYDEVEFDRSDYSCYEGNGVCLYSLDLGECEEQVEISGYEELQELHDQGRLDDVLDSVNCDLYISRSKKRVKNEKTGYYEEVGRETYMPYEHSKKHPDFLGYFSPGGQWHYIVSEDTVDEAMKEAYRACAT